jgi:hypothetical protein
VSREEKIREIASALEGEIKRMPGMCCFGRRMSSEDGSEETYQVGFDGFVDLLVLAEWVYARMG